MRVRPRFLEGILDESSIVVDKEKNRTTLIIKTKAPGDEITSNYSQEVKIEFLSPVEIELSKKKSSFGNINVQYYEEREIEEIHAPSGNIVKQRLTVYPPRNNGIVFEYDAEN